MNIRNFVIISHIDHGKSTLADRFLEVTETVAKDKIKPQMLDSMELEREKGITIKMAPVRMEWKDHIFNLIDTPGHVDFSYEVSRALACVEGAILLVDATKGIQAQTLSNFYAAQKANLIIIPAVNKVDLPSAAVDETAMELFELTGTEPLKISGKTGLGVEDLLKTVATQVPPAPKNDDENLKALVFDSLYDEHRGVIVYVRIFDGQVKRGDKIKFLGTKKESDVLEVGYFRPHRVSSQNLLSGEIGYIVTDLKSVGEGRVGDTIVSSQFSVASSQTPIPGFAAAKPMVYASFYPVSPGDYPLLRKALERTQLTDASLIFEPETIPALGSGFRIGFLGLLHLEIIFERVRREFDVELVATTPSVAYQPVTRNSKLEYNEPFVKLQVISPPQYLGAVMQLLHEHRGQGSQHETVGDRNIITAEIPLAEVIIDFYDRLKSVTQGYASMDYELIGYRESDLVQMDVLIAEEKVEPFSQLVHRSKLEKTARNITAKLKDLIPRQNFEVKIQAAVGAKIIAGERIAPLRKDVTAKLYGGDVTRKNKLLDKQKKGKARLKRFGKVDIPTDVFLNVLKRQ